MTTAIPSLSTRVVLPEIMDQPDLHPHHHRTALSALARLNWWSGASRPYRALLRRVADEVQPRPVTLLDVATGGGDVPVALGRWARRVGIDLRIAVCDNNPRAVRLARERADHGNMSSPTILFILRRLLDAEAPRPWVALAFGPGLTTEALLLR